MARDARTVAMTFDQCAQQQQQRRRRQSRSIDCSAVTASLTAIVTTDICPHRTSASRTRGPWTNIQVEPSPFPYPRFPFRFLPRLIFPSPFLSLPSPFYPFTSFLPSLSFPSLFPTLHFPSTLITARWSGGSAIALLADPGEPGLQRHFLCNPQPKIC